MVLERVQTYLKASAATVLAHRRAIITVTSLCLSAILVYLSFRPTLDDYMVHNRQHNQWTNALAVRGREMP